jgi:PAS domain S-box-containing protein
VIGTIIEVRDITQEKLEEQAKQESVQREQALRQSAQSSQQSLETILSSISDGFYVLDCDWRFTYVNDRHCEMIGMTREQILGRSVWDLFPEAVEMGIYEQFHQALQDQTVMQFETHYTPWSRWFEHRIYPSSSGLTVFVADTTDRRQSEELLRESEERFRNMADHAPVMIWVTDSTGKCTYLSRSWYNFTGQTQETGLGFGWLKAVHPEDSPASEATFLEASKRHEPFRLEYRLKHKDGKYRWAIDAASPRFGIDGQFQGFIGSVFDITERKQSEHDREQLLKREQTARAEAQAANQVKDEFLAVLSHELRTPMNPILGWAKLLRSGKLNNTKATQAIDTIERNAQLQVQLIDDLLDISRILQGKLSLNRAPINLSLVITAAIETVQLAAAAKAIVIQSFFLSSAPVIQGDPGRIQQVLWNLLANAVKFTPANGHIEVQLSQTETTAEIQVKDSGKGITPEFLPYVFEHFRQEDGATTRKFGGLGLGLSIARQIVELHGGQIAVESKGEGQGATFTVQIPLMPPENKLPIAELPVPCESDLRNVQILIVDDEIDSREFVAFVLEQEGAIVTQAPSGTAALEQLEQTTFDLLISDIGMPEMDGYMLIQKARQIQQQQQIPAIALTAYAGEIDRQQSIAAGFDRHLAKPINPDELLRTVRMLRIHPLQNPTKI